MSKRTAPVWVALCLAVGSLPHASAAPIPLDGTVAVMTRTLISGSPAQYSGSTQTANANYDPIFLYTYATSDVNGENVTASTSIYAAWDSPSSGYVAFGESGFTNNAPTSSGSENLEGSRWTYRFRAGDDATLTLDYSVDLTPDTTDGSSLQGIWFAVILNGYEPVTDQVLPPGSSGTLTVPLKANQSYAVSLIPLAALSGDLGSLTAGMEGSFSWAISEGQ